VRLSTEFFICTSHFQNFKLIFFLGFLYLYQIPLLHPVLSSLLQSAIYLHFSWIHSGFYTSSLIPLNILIIILFSSLRFYPCSLSLKSFIIELLTWRRHVALFFHITCFSTLRFMQLRLRFCLEVLISYILSGVFTRFRQDWILAGLWCFLSPLDWAGWEGVWLSNQKFAHHTQDTGYSSLLHSGRRLAIEAITVDKHTHYENSVIST
jgi:hypothetical protein